MCGLCIGDPILAEFITANATALQCDYCNKLFETACAAGLSEVVQFMAEIINEEWTDPVHELAYESREGGYQGDAIDAYDLMEEIGFEPENSELFDDVVSHFIGHDWCRRDYYSVSPAERHQIGWQRFCREVMHSRRYTFWSALEDGLPEFHPDHLPPGMMLGEVSEIISELSLIREFPAGTRFWRAQEHDLTVTLEIPTKFTSPPLKFSVQPNRMSPAGISMFYGTEDFETAALEVSGKEIKSGRSVSAIQFEACRTFQLLDLIVMEQRVSYFASGGRDWRQRSRFLRYFTQEVSKPIEKDKRQHLEYVPTQVFTEYVRYHMLANASHPIDGIRYSSSQNQRPCCVLFFDSDDCLRDQDGRPQALRAVPNSLRTVSLESPR